MSSRPADPALLLAAIVDSSADAIVSKDLDGVITSWNRGAERLFGYSADEAVGRPVTMLIPDERLSEEDVVLVLIRKGERVEPFDTVRRRKDHTLVDVSVTVSPVRASDGTIVGASKIARDISYRKRVDEELGELKDRLLALAGASASILGSPDMATVLSGTIELARRVIASDAYALWRLDPASGWRMLRAFGVSEEFSQPIAGSSVLETSGHAVAFSEPLVIEDVEHEPALAGRRDAYRREGVVSMVVFPLSIRGERTATLVFYSRLPRRYRDTDIQVGTALANIAAASLTTAELYAEQRARREAADQARQRAAFLAEAGTALSASLDYERTLKVVAGLAVPLIADWCAVDIVDNDGRPQRLAVAHVDPEKIELAHRLEQQYPADPKAPGGMHEVLRTGRPSYVPRIAPDALDRAARDDEHRRILRSLRLTSFMCVPLLAQGKTLGTITFVSAESGREYTENDLRLAQELAARASLAVENARAYARAHEASRLKDEFLATLSHELRTPLNAVLGYARMLRSGAVAPERTNAALEIVERNATALKQIIEDVLDVSRIISGRLRLDVAPVDLPAILHDSCATVLPAADAKGVRLETIVDPLTTPVSGDGERLQQIVWNLLSNAIKFTARGGKVQLRLSRVNSHVEVTVSDTGRGISADFLPFVFDRFRQGDATSSREHGGLGLGLAIAKQLTELHGGTLSAMSDGPGTGATFTLTLPLRTSPAAPTAGVRDQTAPERRVPALANAPRLDGLRVLAVDDETDSLQLVRTVLEGAGAAVRLAGSAQAALDAISSDAPDVIVADIGMPEMDGLELIGALRRLEEPARSIPAAALTAYARSQDRIVSLASGFQMHLVKPIDPLELIVAVSTLAARRHSRR